MAVQARDPKVKHAARKRDNTTCQKCGQRLIHLHTHHIVPLRLGGEDTVENLITLCAACHYEWEGLTAATGDGFNFDKWLTLPPWHMLVPVLLSEKLWRQDMSAAQMRDFLLNSNAFDVLRQINSYELRPGEHECD